MRADNTDIVTTGVLVVGGGPTGLTLANILGHSNVPFMLIDQKPSTIAEPRAVSIDDESLRTMQAVDLAGPVMQDVVPGYGVHYISRPGGTCFGKVEPTASEYGFPRRNAFRQPLFEATLRNGAERFSCGQIRFAHTLDSFEQDDNGVSARVIRPDGSQLSVRARFLVACDGGRSPIRERLGIKLVGSTFKSRWLVIDTEKDTDPFSQMRVYCDPARPIVDVPGPHNTRRYEILVHPHESTEAVLEEAAIAAWLRPLRADTPMHVVRKTVYTFHARVAERWQVGRIFLAGDAAHLTPPYAGQGMNSGVRDAHNLGWKLAAVLRGQLPESILTSYEPERRKHAWSLIRLALNLGIVMAPSSRLSAVAWQGFFRVTRFIPPIRDFFMQMKFKPKPKFEEGLLAQDSPGARCNLRGRMLPQPEIVSTDVLGKVGDSQKLDDIIGHRFALIQYGGLAETLGQLSHPLWDLLGAKRIRILPPESNATSTDSSPNVTTVIAKNESLHRWLGADANRIVLVRPDRYVAGAFDGNAEPAFGDQYALTLGASDKLSHTAIISDEHATASANAHA